MESVRITVARMLQRVLFDGAYSNAIAKKYFTRANMTEQDIAFGTALFYGTIERLYTIDRYLEVFTKMPINDLDKEVLIVLRMGVYQILFMNSVPGHAAVNESVNLIRKLKKSSASGLVNAVLRKIPLDMKIETILKKGSDYSEILALNYSCPKWIVQNLLKNYSESETIDFLKNSLERPPLFVRVNALKISQENLIALLRKKNLNPIKTEIDHCLMVEGLNDIEASEEHQKGYFYVQDMSSQICSIALNAKPGETVIDICSAPGGKSFTIAQEMKNKGTVLSCDIKETKVKKILKGSERLGTSIIKTLTNDGMLFNEKFSVADKVLCDVPCSGIGVIRRRPEIKYKPESETKDLPKIQYRILEISSCYVKPGGTLQYSTCTLLKHENESVVDLFLKKHPEFKKQPFRVDGLNSSTGDITILPTQYTGDGFYICSMRRDEK